MRLKYSQKENLPSSRERKRRVRGQFDPEIALDEHYINARVEAFQKYREKQAPLRVLEVLATNKQLQEQKNLIFLHCKNNTIDITKRQLQACAKLTHNKPSKELEGSKVLLPAVSDKRVSSIWKSYLEKKVVAVEKASFKGIAMSTRINTEAITRRRGSSTSQGLVRRTPANMLIIEDDNIEEPIF